AGRLEVSVAVHVQGDDWWDMLRDEPWLQEFGAGVKREPQCLYVAIVDETGKIVMHSDQSQLDQQLGQGWYERRIPEAGTDVVRLEAGPLSGGSPAYDVAVPLTAGNRRVGEFHAGFDAEWLDSTVAAQQRRSLAHWGWALGLVGFADAGALGGLIFLVRYQRSLGRLLQQQVRSRSREMSQLGAGLAHEIRNPLHAVRINLHTLRRSLSRNSPMKEDQLLAATQDSDAAINRIDGLLRDLLQFVNPAGGNVAEVDLGHEVRASLSLLGEDLRRDRIEVHVPASRSAPPVSIDP